MSTYWVVLLSNASVSSPFTELSKAYRKPLKYFPSYTRFSSLETIFFRDYFHWQNLRLAQNSTRLQSRLPHTLIQLLPPKKNRWNSHLQNQAILLSLSLHFVSSLSHSIGIPKVFLWSTLSNLFGVHIPMYKRNAGMTFT